MPSPSQWPSNNQQAGCPPHESAAHLQTHIMGSRTPALLRVSFGESQQLSPNLPVLRGCRSSIPTCHMSAQTSTQPTSMATHNAHCMLHHATHNLCHAHLLLAHHGIKDSHTAHQLWQISMTESASLIQHRNLTLHSLISLLSTVFTNLFAFIVVAGAAQAAAAATPQPLKIDCTSEHLCAAVISIGWTLTATQCNGAQWVAPCDVWLRQFVPFPKKELQNTKPKITSQQVALRQKIIRMTLYL